MILIICILILPTFSQNCVSQIRGCNNCTSNGKCLNCVGSYFLFNNTCHPCQVPGCNVCPNNPVCTTCRQGYQKRGNNCTICPLSCNKCTSYVCQQCFKGHYLNNSQCTPCLSLFKSCSSCSINECQDCIKGYQFKNGDCVPSSSITQIEIIIIASVSGVIVILVLTVCGLAYYFKKQKRRIIVHETITRSQMGLQIDPQTEAGTQINFR